MPFGTFRLVGIFQNVTGYIVGDVYSLSRVVAILDIGRPVLPGVFDVRVYNYRVAVFSPAFVVRILSKEYRVPMEAAETASVFHTSKVSDSFSSIVPVPIYKHLKTFLCCRRVVRQVLVVVS